ncbi:MAG: stage III sporulation protein AB [Deltaproteobacteria bacterium]
MIKIIGCFIVFAACALIGYFLSASKYERVKELRSFIQALNMLETEIRFALCTLPEAFLKISEMVDGKVSKVFNLASQKLQQNKINASLAWVSALEEKSALLFLNSEDFSILKSLGASLGNADVENQIKSIRLVVESLKNQEYKAEEERSKSGKLLKNMGALVGLTLVIILY